MCVEMDGSSGTLKEGLISVTGTIQCGLEATCTERKAQMQSKGMLGEYFRLTLLGAQEA